MARAALVAALGLELEYPQLRPALVSEHLRADLDSAQASLVEGHLARRGRAAAQASTVAPTSAGQALDEQALAGLDAVLLAAGSHDRVHVLSCWVLAWSIGRAISRRFAASEPAHSDDAAALAVERRRPPLRPRRRGFDCRPSLLGGRRVRRRRPRARPSVAASLARALALALLGAGQRVVFGTRVARGERPR